jgi:ubiquinone/menaquinone biosynthesis C-methylase UbiE
MRSSRSLSSDEVGGGRGGLSRPHPAPDIATSHDEYARRFSGPVGRWFLERQAKIVHELLAPLAPVRILEVGGGHAQLTPSLVEAGNTVTVHGSDESCAQRLRRLYSASQVPFLTGPLDQLPVEDRAFDVVVTVRTMAHVDDPPAFLAECARVSRNGVLFDYPSRKSVNLFADLLFEAKQRIEHDTRIFHSFHDRDVTAWLAQVGMRPERIIRQFFWPMAIHRFHRSERAAAVLEGIPDALKLTRAFGSPVLALYVR